MDRLRESLGLVPGTSMLAIQQPGLYVPEIVPSGQRKGPRSPFLSARFPLWPLSYRGAPHLEVGFGVSMRGPRPQPVPMPPPLALATLPSSRLVEGLALMDPFRCRSGKHPTVIDDCELPIGMV